MLYSKQKLAYGMVKKFAHPDSIIKLPFAISFALLFPILLSAQTAKISNISVTHNQTQNGYHGMIIKSHINVSGKKGKKIQIIAWFYDKEGSTRTKNLGNKPYYTSEDGKACCYSTVIPPYDNTEWKSFELFMPYYALKHDKGQNSYSFLIKVRDYETDYKSIGSSIWYDFNVTYEFPSDSETQSAGKKQNKQEQAEKNTLSDKSYPYGKEIYFKDNNNYILLAFESNNGNDSKKITLWIGDETQNYIFSYTGYKNGYLCFRQLNNLNNTNSSSGVQKNSGTLYLSSDYTSFIFNGKTYSNRISNAEGERWVNTIFYSAISKSNYNSPSTATYDNSSTATDNKEKKKQNARDYVEVKEYAPNYTGKPDIVWCEKCHSYDSRHVHIRKRY